MNTNPINQSVWLVFYNNKLLLEQGPDGAYVLPGRDSIAGLGLDLSGKKYLGIINRLPHYTAEIFREPALPGYLHYISLRRLFSTGQKELFKIAGRAVQIVDWDRTHRFCGQCGEPTIEKSNEFAKVCPKCGLTVYPRISPSIIVAVTKGSEILLVRSKHFAYAFHTVISGFVEPGETLEECLQREVKEETGIAVKNICYYGSQPWPFPNSLMLAFTAEYERGDIVIDHEELYEANWFSADRLPFLPTSDSIARDLIDWFIENKSSSDRCV